jgi:hypothetical protein
MNLVFRQAYVIGVICQAGALQSGTRQGIGRDGQGNDLAFLIKANAASQS